MMKATIDLNVLLDFLNKREYHEEAAQIVDLCVRNQVQGYLCAHEFTTLSYFLQKQYKNSKNVKQVLIDLLDIFTILPVTDEVLRGAFGSPINDFEDAVVEVSTLMEKIGYIITRNMSDFKTSRVKALTPQDFLRLFHLTTELS